MFSKKKHRICNSITDFNNNSKPPIYSSIPQFNQIKNPNHHHKIHHHTTEIQQTAEKHSSQIVFLRPLFPSSSERSTCPSSTQATNDVANRAAINLSVHLPSGVLIFFPPFYSPPPAGRGRPHPLGSGFFPPLCRFPVQYTFFFASDSGRW